MKFSLRITGECLGGWSGVKQLAVNFRSVPLTRRADAAVIAPCHENGGEQVRLAGHVTDIPHMASIATPHHFQHGSLHATKKNRGNI